MARRRKGFTDSIKGWQARGQLAAGAFAEAIGRPLNTAVDINWSKTTAGDDEFGQLLAEWRRKAARFLRRNQAGGLTCAWVRENPPGASHRPNAHLNCHVPERLWPAFYKLASTFLPDGCLTLAKSDPAVFVQRTNPHPADRRRRLEYPLKGTSKRARVEMERERSYQGRIKGKRCGTSEDIGVSARIRAQDTAAAA